MFCARAGRVGDRAGAGLTEERVAPGLAEMARQECALGDDARPAAWVCLRVSRAGDGDGGWGAPVAESVLAPPGPIPNPVVTQRSAGEYCGGDSTGGEAAADSLRPRTSRQP